MLGHKCPSCSKRIRKKFDFCPWCGIPLRENRERQDFGMLGKNDNSVNNNMMGQQIKLPFGLEKMMGSLVKQIEKEMGDMGMPMGAGPKGFEIKIQTGNPKNKQPERPQPIAQQSISGSEMKRRESLPQKQAKSKVKRLSDKILYEIEAPGVEKVTDVVITPLERGVEVRAYTKEACYIKTIPMKVQIEKYGVKNGKVFLELKS
jgi:hypothetical protein